MYNTLMAEAPVYSDVFRDLYFHRPVSVVNLLCWFPNKTVRTN